MIYRIFQVRDREYENITQDNILLSVISLADHSVKTDMPNNARARTYKNHLHYCVIQTNENKKIKVSGHKHYRIEFLCFERNSRTVLCCMDFKEEDLLAQ